MCIKNSKVSLTLVGDAVGELEGESEGDADRLCLLPMGEIAKI